MTSYDTDVRLLSCRILEKIYFIENLYVVLLLFIFLNLVYFNLSIISYVQ